MTGIPDVGHMIYDPNVPIPLIVPVACPVADRPEDAPRLIGKLKIKVHPDSLAFQSYQQSDIEEEFHCNFELNQAFQEKLESAGVRITGSGENGEARIMELPDHRFFLGTGYMPQLSSVEGKPHPLFIAYVEAILNSARVK